MLGGRRGARYHGGMTDRFAIFLVVLVAGFLALDHYLLHLDSALFLAREGLKLIETVAFWR